MAAAAILDNFEWPYLHNSSRSIYLYSAHRAVIFAIAQLSCIVLRHIITSRHRHRERYHSVSSKIQPTWSLRDLIPYIFWLILHSRSTILAKLTKQLRWSQLWQLPPRSPVSSIFRQIWCPGNRLYLWRKTWLQATANAAKPSLTPEISSPYPCYSITSSASSSLY